MATGLLRRVPIAARLIGLSVVLVGLMFATSTVLVRALDHAVATAEQSDRLIARIDEAQAIAKAFNDLRYWLTDLSVSQLTLSERNAAAARGTLRQLLDRLATTRPDLAAAIRAEVAAFDEGALAAADAYAEGKRVIGNARLAEARGHGQQVVAQLESLEAELQGKVHEVREAVEAAGASANRTNEFAIAAAIIVATLLTILVLRSILNPMAQLVAAIQATRRGDLSTPLPPVSRDELGAMTRAVHLLREAQSERAQLAQEAEAQRRLVADAIESINEGFVLYDANDKLVMCNTNYVRLQPEVADLMVPGTPFLTVIEAAAHRGLVDLGGRTPDDWIAERLRRHANPQGATEYRFANHWIRIAERRTSDGGTVAIYADITELKQRQQDLEAAREDAVRASHVKSEFLANMSHELRTPLNAIIGYSQLLQEDAQDSGDEASLPDLRKIENAGKHLLGLINDILDLSKIEAGRMEAYIEPVDLPAMAEDVRLMVEPLAAKNGNALVIDCPAGLAAMRTDATKLKQSLLNLLSNACKFTENGQVSLTIRPEEPGRVSFTVADTGIGMTEAQMARLFQAFVQADGSTTRRFGGTGLGLAITRSFAQMLGGDVTVSSVPGQGSQFRLVLPSEPEAPRAGASATAAPAGAHVLVIDDDPAARQIIGQHLLREGYQVSYAASGHQGLELARTASPDAITLDLMMPHLDGWSVLTALKADSELRAIPVILVSIAGDDALGVSLGAAASLAKPVDRAELAAALRALLAAQGEGVILVVEDDPPTRELTERTVAALGHACALAGNGREALDWLEANPPPALILLDLLMPEMDGFEFLHHLRARPEWREIPVIVATAKQIEAAERQLLERTTRDIITKGHSAHRELARAVRDVLAPAGA